MPSGHWSRDRDLISSASGGHARLRKQEVELFLFPLCLTGMCHSNRIVSVFVGAFDYDFIVFIPICREFSHERSIEYALNDSGLVLMLHLPRVLLNRLSPPLVIDFPTTVCSSSNKAPQRLWPMSSTADLHSFLKAWSSFSQDAYREC